MKRLPHYVTTTKGMRGWFAVLVDPTDGLHEPVQTGIGSYGDREGAIDEARDWAVAEALEYRA